ncbi:ArnT family glycosyltransferase [Phaeocystidibacter luteus]|uniref:Glycosyltransferase RgtA/B/C/D-like domain-containing protein n=1 Tax=Phaeocystidibacter luteus TaxID=911197 RepID=A0A6N6RJL8_9FLAO|nr:glycosyltransferase family 39 protein [Phaeocystidibacter luteus]KAB2813840.1 hypothetical protein F8C67_03925 [Phaeocystidibacter luteus]
MKRIFTNGPALITVGICLILILPLLVMDGMFMDAVMYSSVGRNLSEGVGTFWMPYFTEAHMATPSFHENPPLGYGFMAVFYDVLGRGIHTERIFTGLSFLITAILIVKFWRMIWPTHYKMAWLPVLLWVLNTGVQWSFQNNMMENTMGIFVLGGSMAAYRAFKAENRHIYWAIWAGLLIVCGFLVKGLPAFFVWITPIALALAERHSYKKAIVQSVVMVAVAGVAGVALYLYQPARESLEIYLFERTANRLAEGATTEDRYFILRVLAESLAIPGILTFIAGLIFTRVNNERMQWEPLITFLVILGIAGSLPFVATFVQRGFYLVPVYPFFALAFASILRPVIEKTTSKWRRSPYLQVTGWVLIVLGVGTSIYTAGKIKRDEFVIRDVRLLDEQFESRTLMQTNAELNSNWVFKSYLERYARIAISDRQGADDAKFIILPKGTRYRDGIKLDELSEKLKVVDVYEKR